ncbi:SDR family oxidoreductase [Pseudomonas syringae]|uniref:SDR family oxidoreductase n=1 Tax=Pseudomonas syringae TaxID=317 RepID=UPI0010107D79|nr:SDR family oxidoreductase [Pseudomonas syringae]RXT68739.1 short-chain dehydrogenase [Pseudomonas syringae]
MSRNDLNRSFTDQYFIVTGSTQGLGAAVALILAQRGASGLILCGRRPKQGNDQVRRLADLGCQAFFVNTDLNSVENCRAVVEEARKRFGTVHGLVNCAGMSDRGTILDTSPELFEKLFAVNVRAPFFLMQDTIKLMLETGVEGSIVNIQSIVAHGGPASLIAYSASKGALAVLTKNIAFSALRNRIRVNGLNIGWMDTPHEDDIQRRYHGAQDGWLVDAERAQPFGRLLKPEEVGQSVAFLLSRESGMMTGTVIDLEQGVIGCGEEPAPRPTGRLSLEEV